MPPSQSRNSYLLDRSNGPGSSSGTATPAYRKDPAVSPLTDEISRLPQTVHADFQDPFAYYKAFTNTTIPPIMSTPESTHDDDSYIRLTRVTGAQADQSTGFPRQVSARAVPYHLAARLANRSNGAPLATIIEQGSYSTLNSHGSLLSIGRFPSMRVEENTAPSRASQRVLRRPDEHAMQGNEETVSQDQGLCAVITTDEETRQSRGRSYPVNAIAMTTGSTPFQLSQCLSAQIGDTNYYTDSRRPNGFFRDFMHNVCSTSQARSRSSSTMHTSIVDVLEGQAKTSENSPNIQLQSPKRSPTNSDLFNTPYRVPTSSVTATCTPGPEYEARNRKVSNPESEHSARAYPPLLNNPMPKIESESDSGSVPHLLSPLVATRSRERSSSKGLVQPEPRDVAHEDGTAGAPTLSNENRHDTSAQYTFDGISVLHNNAHALVEVNCARESSRNASCCSTMSTSYSGTILGVDLDLDHDHELAHPTRRSRSSTPVAQVWFTPEMAELERQASVSESAESGQAFPIESPCRSINSSALASLLPIAAATGIVRPNLDTPEISFYSPSGNLIQPEGSSTPRTSASDFGALPAMIALRYDEDAPFSSNVLTARAYPPPARPFLVPMTTCPTSSAPLPPHLKNHHHYRHHERSQINSCESLIEHSLAVKGCGGIVRDNTYSSRSRVERRHPKRQRSNRSIISDLKSRMKFTKFLSIPSASDASLSSNEKRKPRKRHSIGNHSANAHAYRSTITPDKRTMGVNGTSVSTLTHQNPQDKQHEGVLGPLAGHALRICFCQPYDGAGKRTDAGTLDAFCLSRPRRTYDTDKKDGDVRVKKTEADLPAARVISSRNNSKYSYSRCTKKEDVSDEKKLGRTRSDSVVSVGIGLRVATLGG